MCSKLRLRFTLLNRHSLHILLQQPFKLLTFILNLTNHILNFSRCEVGFSLLWDIGASWQLWKLFCTYWSDICHCICYLMLPKANQKWLSCASSDSKVRCASSFEFNAKTPIVCYIVLFMLFHVVWILECSHHKSCDNWSHHLLSPKAGLPCVFLCFVEWDTQEFRSCVWLSESSAWLGPLCAALSPAG